MITMVYMFICLYVYMINIKIFKILTYNQTRVSRHTSKPSFHIWFFKINHIIYL
jgi:hypothetical protein